MRSLLVALALFAGACGPPCFAKTPADAADVAECLAKVKEECAGIPEGEPCPFEDECNARAEKRCGE